MRECCGHLGEKLRFSPRKVYPFPAKLSSFQLNFSPGRGLGMGKKDSPLLG